MANGHMKRCLTSLTHRKMPNKISLHSYWMAFSKNKTKQNISGMEVNMEKWEHMCTVGGSAKWCSHHGTQCRDHSKTKNRTNIWSSNPTFGYTSKIIEINFKEIPAFPCLLLPVNNAVINMEMQINLWDSDFSFYICIFIHTYMYIITFVHTHTQIYTHIL